MTPSPRSRAVTWWRRDFGANGAHIIEVRSDSALFNLNGYEQVVLRPAADDARREAALERARALIEDLDRAFEIVMPTLDEVAAVHAKIADLRDDLAALKGLA